MSTVVLTGASSFSGTWFARQLSARGHRVVAPLARPMTAYEGIREQRVRMLADIVDVLEGAPMGSPALLRGLSRLDQIDAVLWHHAVVGSYLSREYPLGDAISSAICGIAEMASILKARGCSTSVITHSVFESDQGIPSAAPPIGLYGVAKRAVCEAIALEMAQAGIASHHFVVCNPVGPLEEPRFVSYLVSQWKEGRVATLRAPHWIRDNVPIELLSIAYADFLDHVFDSTEMSLTPSWWAESNWDWAQRVGREVAPRLGLTPRLDRDELRDETQPTVRIGKDRHTPPQAWDEASFWDRYAEYYA